MSVTIEAVYENGALRPLEPLALNEGEHVTVVENDDKKSRHDPRRAAEIMAEIAAQSARYGRVETGSVDHDHYLYGAPKQSELQNDNE